MANEYEGKVMTVLGPVEPEELGAVMMHDHIYADLDTAQEGPTPPERVKLLRAYCAPNLRRLNEYGCHAIMDPTPIPMRAEPWVYKEMATQGQVHIILATGFYREAAPDEFRPCGADIPHRWLDPRVVEGTVDSVADIMVSEFEQGIRGSDVRPGIIKLGSTSSTLTAGEERAFRAGAKAQRLTGLPITTHVQGLGTAEAQLDLLEEAGADPHHVILGHTTPLLVETPWTARRLAERGASFIIHPWHMDGPLAYGRRLVDGINRFFDDGYGDRLTMGMDWAFENEMGPFVECWFVRQPPYVCMFMYNLPRLRESGLEEAVIEWMLVKNPARLLPVQLG